ncbi:MAG: ABC transporter permease subunit, partial [Candidatus Omnitrophica bacterium]|nr:ABC transporter permease subunit [Candidatus Omnitrophota bacterium]
FSPRAPIGNFFETFLHTRIVFTFLGLVIGSVIFSLPFMVNPLKSAFQSFSSSLIEASYSLGKTRRETLFRVILPNVKPALLTGVVMSFAHTIGEFGVVLMIGGNIPGETRLASIAIFGEVESLNYANAHFYSTILFTISFVILFSLNFLSRKGIRSISP